MSISNRGTVREGRDDDGDCLEYIESWLIVARKRERRQATASTQRSLRLQPIRIKLRKTRPQPLIFRQTTLRGIAVAPRSSFDRMNLFLNEHKIRPVIDQVYPFEQAREAYEHLAKGAFGKVVIKVAK